MNYANLIQNITENIKTNGSQAITAQVLQDVLVDMVGELGQSGALLGGVIDTSFVPDSTNDAQVVYIAEAPGTYTNFNGLVVGAGEVAFFYFDGNAWAKSSVDVLEVVNNLNSTATDKALSAAMGKQLQDSLTQAVQDLTTAIGNKADTTYVDTQLATKADNASVNAALALKADTSAVNAALATKADTSALAAKADKVVGAVAGNMAALDASGNLVDSGINSSAVGDVANKIDRVADAEVGNVPMFKADGGIEDSGIPAENIAEQDGYYETMVVGGAENLIGNDIVSSQFTRRKTGGSADVGTGVAILKTIKGNTLVWNQLVDTGTTSVTIPSGHKYYAIINGVRSMGTSTGAAIAVTGGTDSVFNLTLMFGSGNEPSTAAEFESLFPLNYYAYNTGSLLNLTATGLQTNGFNQWDEEWESGYYDSSGNKQNATNQICTKNLIPVFPGITYNNSKYNGASGILYYDADKQFINRVTAPGNPVTIPSGVYFVKINFGSTYGSTYNRDICINISDVNKNGAYEPYWSETKALPITTATSGGVAIFSDGLKSAGTAHDRYYKSAGSDLFDKAQEVIGSLNLGTLTGWTYNSANQYFYINANYIKLPADWATVANIKCATYYPVTGNAIANGTAANMSIAYAPNGTILIKNTAYTTSAQLEAGLAGVTLYFESRTVTEYTLDTPFNGQYKVDNDGTETLLPENTSTPTTSPIVADINYALNAIDTIRNLPQNYISKASMDAILTAFKTAGVITNYTLTWDATNQKYNCTITA